MCSIMMVMMTMMMMTMKVPDVLHHDGVIGLVAAAVVCPLRPGGVVPEPAVLGAELPRRV